MGLLQSMSRLSKVMQKYGKQQQCWVCCGSRGLWGPKQNRISECPSEMCAGLLQARFTKYSKIHCQLRLSRYQISPSNYMWPKEFMITILSCYLPIKCLTLVHHLFPQYSRIPVATHCVIVLQSSASWKSVFPRR